MSVSRLKHLASFLYPIKLETQLSEFSNTVEVYLDKGQYMLCSPEAMYSFGLQYAPFQKAFAYLYAQNKLKAVEKFLLLGGGFCSAVVQLHQKYNLPVQSTVIEKDNVIATLAAKYLHANILLSTTILTENAFDFVTTDIKKYNLIGIDIFIDMKMPRLVSEANFLELCKNKLHVGGSLIINTYFEKAADAAIFDEAFKSVFKHLHVIMHQRNNIYLGFEV